MMTIGRTWPLLLAILSVSSGCAAQSAAASGQVSPPASPAPSSKTIINDRAAFQRLLGNGGVSLQWISWETRGNLVADYSTDLLRLHGGQSTPDGKGKLMIDGVVTKVDASEFTFVGRIDMRDTPDIGRHCVRDGEMTFRVTQNRKYWRLQQMEVCDGLTDYVDIYF